MNILITGVYGFVKYNLFINNRFQVFYLNYKKKNKLLKEKVNALEIAQIECDNLRKASSEYQSILNEIKQLLNSLKNV